MTHPIESLAAPIGFRDREALDVSLVVALRDLLRPLRGAIFRFSGDGADRRWPTRANLTAVQAAASVGCPWLSDADTPSSAFERADKAAYFAKAHGCNEWVGHAGLVTSGQPVEARSSGTDLF